MSTHLARGGRRRRVLNDELRTAATLTVASAPPEPTEAPRYGEMASVEHHPQITDYVPRRTRAAAAILVSGAAVAASTEAVRLGAESVASALPGIAAQQITAQLADGVAAWTSAIALLATAGLAQLIYSLRRHRVDDVRGRYRAWKWVVWGALAMSVNAVVDLHVVLSQAAAAATGWSFTATAAEWWLAPAALLGGWIALRVALEIAESPGSLTMLIGAVAWCAIGGVGSLGWMPAALGPWGAWVAGAAPLMGQAFLLACMMLFARYVVLDVQGLIEHPQRSPASSAMQRANKREAAGAAPAPTTLAAVDIRAARHDRDAGDEDESEGSDGGDRFPSKSDRKRLRKQQRQNRAA